MYSIVRIFDLKNKKYSFLATPRKVFVVLSQSTKTFIYELGNIIEEWKLEAFFTFLD